MGLETLVKLLKGGPKGDTVIPRSADLLVMGAYSHTRLRERILGGVTKYVLEHAEIPVLAFH